MSKFLLLLIIGLVCSCVSLNQDKYAVFSNYETHTFHCKGNCEKGLVYDDIRYSRCFLFCGKCIKPARKNELEKIREDLHIYKCNYGEISDIYDRIVIEYKENEFCSKDEFCAEIEKGNTYLPYVFRFFKENGSYSYEYKAIYKMDSVEIIKYFQDLQIKINNYKSMYNINDLKLNL